MKRLLLIEDDTALSTGIKMALESERISVTQCYLYEEAKQEVLHSYDTVLLDLNLPDGNGMDILKEAKRHTDTPVIILTANDMETDIVAGLKMGADDYITKPFSLAVLKARIDVQLRKENTGAKREPLYEKGDYCFDFAAGNFRYGIEKIELSQTEQRLLYLFVKNSGRTMKREEMEYFIWGNEYAYLDINTLSVCVKRLRTKLSDKEHIKTVYGIGYRWE